MNFGELAQKFQVSEDEFKHMIARVFSNNLSALAFFEGYGSEYILEKIIKNTPSITAHYKPGDNNTEIKGDVVVTYKDVDLRIEAKSIKRRTNSISRKPQKIVNLEEEYWIGFFQTRASRNRKLVFSDGSVAHTYNCLRNQYDIIAVNVFQLSGKQEFMYCLEENLPSTEYCATKTNLTPLQCVETLRGEVSVRWPPVAPWTSSLEEILEQAYQNKLQSATV